MKKYELLLALPGTLDDNEAKKRSEEILAMLKEFDAEATLTTMGKTRLAYPIKQIRYGYFYTIVFSVETDALKTIQEKLNLSRDLLRAVITEFNAKYNPNQKISYITNAIGVTTVGEMTDDAPSEMPVVPTLVITSTYTPAPATTSVDNAVDMTDINKKLDEILAGDLTPGV
ncbi:MAG: 30S ribosomal protein S6 [Candidatus Magasanikbacteria bacterium RIFOXYC2_FULL_42_28]|uniref:Small ribosomal subunit protein bS6 n=1 Tax=Candidatus Magasanikbacteria bacterium RIFOXYC2_FULL_42_28 TaxID=1798704 RepID=A0A1F6NVH6_9BACT|nr:MAG: 30S ribosomal protein S6 [Candidatus Magasanikbacteria bacterium RIFOXYC2_FULL_42_28]